MCEALIFLLRYFLILLLPQFSPTFVTVVAIVTSFTLAAKSPLCESVLTSGRLRWVASVTEAEVLFVGITYKGSKTSKIFNV